MGISAIISAVVDAVASVSAVGVAEGVAVGAGLGAAESAITGGNPLTGALTGGVTGGFIEGLGPVIGEATGFGETASDALAGAAGGAVGSGATGGNPLMGAAEGAISGGVAANMPDVFGGSGTGTPNDTAATTGAGGSPAISTSPTASGGATGGIVSPSGATDLSISDVSSALNPSSSVFGKPNYGDSVGVWGYHNRNGYRWSWACAVHSLSYPANWRGHRRLYAVHRRLSFWTATIYRRGAKHRSGAHYSERIGPSCGKPAKPCPKP